VAEARIKEIKARATYAALDKEKIIKSANSLVVALPHGFLQDFKLEDELRRA
jgi:hypothetical protein